MEGCKEGEREGKMIQIEPVQGNISGENREGFELFIRNISLMSNNDSSDFAVAILGGESGRAPIMALPVSVGLHAGLESGNPMLETNIP